MKYRLRRADLNDANSIRDLQQLHVWTFPACPVPDFTGIWWFVDCDDWWPAGFGGFSRSTLYPNAAYLWRTGIRAAHRGHGLQRMLIRACATLARRQGFSEIISDTNQNPISAKNFRACQWEEYAPDAPWSFNTAVYWRKRFK